MGVEPPRDSVSVLATLAGSCHTFRRDFLVLREGKEGAGVEPAGVFLSTVFGTAWPAACRTFPVQERPDSNRDRVDLESTMLRAYTTLLKVFANDAGGRTRTSEVTGTPVLQTGAFAAQPRPREFARLKTERATVVGAREWTHFDAHFSLRVLLAASSRLSQRPSEAATLRRRLVAALSSRSQGNSVVKQQKERDSWLPREAVPLRSILEVYFGDWRAGDPLSRRLNLVFALIREARILNRGRALEFGLTAE